MPFCTVYGSSLFGIDYVENEADSFFFFLFLALLSVMVLKNKGGKAGSLLRQGVAGG